MKKSSKNTIKRRLSTEKPYSKSALSVKKKRINLKDDIRQDRPLSEKEKHALNRKLRNIESATLYEKGLNRISGGFSKTIVGESDRDTIDITLVYGVEGTSSEEEKIVINRKTMDRVRKKEEGGYMAEGGSIKKLYKINNLPDGWILEDSQIREDFIAFDYKNGKYEIRVVYRLNKGYLIITEYNFEKNYSTDFLQSNIMYKITSGISNGIEFSDKTSPEKVNERVLRIMNDVNDGKYEDRVIERQAEFDKRRINKKDGNSMSEGGHISPEKARKILHDGEVHGKPLTEEQRKFFGARASGYPVKRKEEGGYMAEGGNVDYSDLKSKTIKESNIIKTSDGNYRFSRVFCVSALRF